MFLAGDGHNNIYYTKDSLDGWNSSRKWAPNSFDYILANPPMGKYSGSANLLEFTFTSQKVMEQLFVEKMILSLKEGGRMAIIINDGPLENPSLSLFRKKVIESLNIVAVVSLPKYSFAPYTQEKTYILIGDKKVSSTDKNDKIFMFMVDYDGFSNNGKRYKTKYHDDLPMLEDAITNFLTDYKLKTLNDLKEKFDREVNEVEKNSGLFGYKCKIVSLDEIISNDYTLLVEKYLRSASMRPSMTLEDASNKIESLIESIKAAVSDEN